MKTVEQYLELPYHVHVGRDDEGADGAWAARVEELPECTATGTTPEEAVARARGLMATWIQEALDARKTIPQPRPDPASSGRLLVRMPRTLHAELARAAETEGISLNQLINGVLSAGVGWRRADDGQDETASRPASRLLLYLLLANLAVLVLAAGVAVAALIAAWG
jgi:antitoxin HicB